MGAASAVAPPTVGRGRGRANAGQSSGGVGGASQQARPPSGDAVPQDREEGGV